MPKDTKSRKIKGKVEGKRKKDPGAPKRGLSAYMFFANATRDKVRQENPDIKFGEVGKILGEKWKELTPKDKEPYENKAKDDKERYEREKADYAKAGEEDEEED